MMKLTILTTLLVTFTFLTTLAAAGCKTEGIDDLCDCYSCLDDSECHNNRCEYGVCLPLTEKMNNNDTCYDEVEPVGSNKF